MVAYTKNVVKNKILGLHQKHKLKNDIDKKKLFSKTSNANLLQPLNVYNNK